MLKTENGYEVMEGTSADSRYPVYMWHNNGVRLGLRFHFKKISTSMVGVVGYARAQQFEEGDNSDQVPSFKAMFDAVGKIGSLTMRGPKHMSGQLISVMAKIPPENGSMKGAVQEMAQSLAQGLGKMAKDLSLTKLKDEYIIELITAAFYEGLDIDPDEKVLPPAEEIDASLDAVEGQLGAGGFDFMKMLGSPKPDED